MDNKSSLTLRPELVTERLLLRRPDKGDAGAIVRIAGDWEVARRLARVPHPYGPADAALFLEHVVPTEWVWGITILGCPELIGVVGLTPTDAADEAELGYWLSRDHWGVGIMTEAARSVVTYGFDALELDLITAGFFKENPASGQVLEKLGFVEIGRDMRWCLATGTNKQSIAMRLARANLIAG